MNPSFSRIHTNGIQLHVAEAGPSAGPLVILLHGFPEFWYAWRTHIPLLSSHGLHVVAPDMRGYNLSDKPKGIGSYHLDHLAADITGLADHFRTERFVVVGHDWGAVVAWWLAAKHPHRIRRAVMMNAPFPAVWMEAMRQHPEQRRKSSYVAFIQLPLIPEMLIGINRRSVLKTAFRDCTRPEAFTAADIEQYRIALSQPGALTATLNYYRAMRRKSLAPAATYSIDVPVLLIWGDRDAYAIPELADASMQLCRDGQLVRFPNSTHWVHHEEPAKIVQMIVQSI